jgi:hypothetical protein
VQHARAVWDMCGRQGVASGCSVSPAPGRGSRKCAGPRGPCSPARPAASLSWPSAPRTHAHAEASAAARQPRLGSAWGQAVAAAPQMRCAGCPGRPQTPAAHSYPAPASFCHPPCVRAAWAWVLVRRSPRRVVVGGTSSRVGAPNELAVLDDAPQLGQDGLPHVNCAHAQRGSAAEASTSEPSRGAPSLRIMPPFLVSFL